MRGERRLRRERRTVRAMVEIYCRAQHGRGELCGSCRELLAYADQRLERCVFGPKKPTCADCPIHCYRPEPRERMREVMRFAGPRMLLRHPILALFHLWVDGRRTTPDPHVAALRGARRRSGVRGGSEPA
jgi:hypothetical protein